MFLDEITLVRTQPCLAEPGKVVIVGRPARALDEVVPYLATLPNVIAYNPDTLTLTLRRQPGFLTFYPEQIYITQVKDTEEGTKLLAALVDAINKTWEHRDELVAVTARRYIPRPLDVWSLLPQTNCKQCGEATCMAFAVTLIQHTRTPNDCVPLMSDSNLSSQKAALDAML
jgi:ArsR family metal-binding transcriptional regulator